MPAAPELVDGLLRALAMLAACGAAGLALFRSTAAGLYHPVSRKHAWHLATAAVVLGALHLLAQPARFTGSFTDTFSAEWLGLTLESYGTGAGLRLAALALSVISLYLQPPHARLAGLTGLLLLASGYALTGHSSGGSGLMVVLAAHVAFFSVWWGSLLGLEAMRRRQDTVAFGITLQRFSAGAVLWFPLLPLSGLWLAWQLLGGPPFAAHLYTILLATKLVLVAAATLLAALNRWHCTPRLLQGTPRSAHTAALTLRAEVALVAAIMVATVTMTSSGAPQ